MFSDKMKKILAASAVTTAVVCTTAAAANVTVTADSLNVRSGAGTNYKVITTVKKGTVLQKLGTSGNWVKVKVNGKTGYVSGKYVKNGGKTSSSSDKSSSKSFQVKVTASSLNVRKGAGTSYATIGSLKKNATATVVGQSNGWYKIKYGKGYGYISSKYTTKTGSSSSSSSSSSKVNYNVKVTASSLNVRKGAGTDYATIGSLKKGDVVKATAKKNGWYKIQYKGGTGYISAKYAEKTSAKVTSSSGSASSSSSASSSNASDAPTSYKWKKTFEATAYTGGGTTASGLAAKVGRVAVDPKVIPLGSELYISGYGYCTAADTGGAIKGNIVDLYFNTYSECVNFGRRNVTVYFIK